MARCTSWAGSMRWSCRWRLSPTGSRGRRVRRFRGRRRSFRRGSRQVRGFDQLPVRPHVAAARVSQRPRGECRSSSPRRRATSPWCATGSGRWCALVWSRRRRSPSAGVELGQQRRAFGADLVKNRGQLFGVRLPRWQRIRRQRIGGARTAPVKGDQPAKRSERAAEQGDLRLLPGDIEVTEAAEWRRPRLGQVASPEWDRRWSASMYAVISLLAWSSDSHCERHARRLVNWPNHDSMNARGLRVAVAAVAVGDAAADPCRRKSREVNWLPLSVPSVSLPGGILRASTAASTPGDRLVACGSAAQATSRPARGWEPSTVVCRHGPAVLGGPHLGHVQVPPRIQAGDPEEPRPPATAGGAGRLRAAGGRAGPAAPGCGCG
jgi:hypothetical protein